MADNGRRWQLRLTGVRHEPGEEIVAGECFQWKKELFTGKVEKRGNVAPFLFFFSSEVLGFVTRNADCLENNVATIFWFYFYQWQDCDWCKIGACG